jgi:hypothetical protein
VTRNEKQAYYFEGTYSEQLHSVIMPTQPIKSMTGSSYRLKKRISKDELKAIISFEEELGESWFEIGEKYTVKIVPTQNC